jgi:flagellar biosynthesis regulator FlbT
MQTTYRLNANEIDIKFIEKLKKLFKNKEISIKIEEINPPVNQREILKSLREHRKKYPPKVISPDIDIHAILKEINDNVI